MSTEQSHSISFRGLVELHRFIGRIFVLETMFSCLHKLMVKKHRYYQIKSNSSHIQDTPTKRGSKRFYSRTLAIKIYKHIQGYHHCL